MPNNKNLWSRLTDTVIGAGNGSSAPTIPNLVHSATYNLSTSSSVLATAKTPEERERKLTQMKQQRYLSHLWAKTGYDTAVEQSAGANQVKVMYRDADLMDQWPEIRSALTILSQEATTFNKDGKMLNIYSKSDRIKAILEDLFVNRLDIHIWLPLIVRATCKYGNEFMFLNLDAKNGVLGWRELPVHEMRRVENGMENAYGAGGPAYISGMRLKPDEVKFVWEGHNEDQPFKNWMIGHFRLINDNLYLPYGVSWLNGARRHWRILSMMEDAMLLYRLERSVSRRIFKVNVGLIDDADVPAFLQEFMNTVKRAPIMDPQTGMMDLRKNFLDVSADYVIPVRPGQDPTAIETLSSAENSTSMDDIKFIEDKVLSALMVPKTFLNFQEAQGKGQNLSLLDIRFNRVVNGIQQEILMELNKIAMIHLSILGFEDECTNFTLTLNNPSNQLEVMELDNLTKRLAAATSALAEQGSGLPLMSWHEVQKKIMGKTDSEIADTLNDIRLESAISAEWQRTSEIIKQTHIFDKVDRIYGEPGAKYSANPPQGEGGPGGTPMGGGAPIGGGGFGDDLGDMGEPGADDTGDVGGDMGSMDLGGGAPDTGGAPTENIHQTNGREVITEDSDNLGKMLFYNAYLKKLHKTDEGKNARVDVLDKSFMVNEEIDSIIKELEGYIAKQKDILSD